MIVRNESAIIERCLLAAAPHVDAYVVVDTGSTDDTVEIVERTMRAAGVPGEVVRGEFRNFEQARNDALDAARASELEFDYILLCDADMDFHVDDANFRARLTGPAYRLLQRNTGIGYMNMRVVRRDVPARYVGVTHEFLDVDGATIGNLSGAWFWDHAEGSSRAVKYERDIALLTEALRSEPDNARHVFYLAQSYRDCDRHRESLETYRRRVELGGWDEEVWYSLLQIAVLSEKLGLDEPEIVQAYLAAFQARPTRSEPLVALAKYYRDGRRFVLAHLVAAQACRIAKPDDLLFIDESAYSWRALDEFAVAAYWTGNYQDCARACRALLAGTALPATQRKRVEDNLAFAVGRLPHDAVSMPRQSNVARRPASARKRRG
ncbi:MAG: glycosyltransferase [Sporichthyaceae bacterium]